MLIRTRIRFPIKAYFRCSGSLAQNTASASAAAPGSVQIPNVHKSRMDFFGSELFFRKKATKNLCLFCNPRGAEALGKFTSDVKFKNSLKVMPVKFMASRKIQKAQQKLTGNRIMENTIFNICFVIKWFTPFRDSPCFTIQVLPASWTNISCLNKCPKLSMIWIIQKKQDRLQEIL